ncbi:MAG: bile acid:sodium symporter family protein [Candidatus Omnitrophota bacterium]
MINRIADWFTRKLVLWVLSAVALGYLWPQSLIGFRPYTEWLFAVTMFGIGAVLSSEDFKPVLKSPQSVLLGTAAQFAIMPLSGFLLAKMLHLPAELALGVILVGATPGAMASNVISYLAKADVAYSVALTTTSTLLSPLLTPLFTYIFAHSFIEIKFLPMVTSIVKMVILPLFLGMLARHYFREKIEKIIKVFPALSSLFIAFICGLVVALNKDYLAGITLMVFAAVFLHNLAGLILGYGTGRLYRFDTKRCRTLSFEVGMQNAGLGAVLALKHFSAATAIPNALFATWCIITAAILAEFWRKRG